MSTPAWALAGNSGPDLSNDFLGTTDSNHLVLKTANIERLRMDFSGNAGISANLGIGTAFRGLAKTPTSQLHIDVPASPNPISGLSIDVESFQTPANAKASYFLRCEIGPRKLFPTGFALFIIRGDGTVGIGTPNPTARLSVVDREAPVGSVQSPTFLTYSGELGQAVGNEVVLASFGLPVPPNHSYFGVRAIRTGEGVGWGSTAIGLGMDVDDTPRAGASLFLNANGNVGIGTATPTSRFHLALPGGASPINAMDIDVSSFGTPANAAASHFLRVRDIFSAPPAGFTHFIIRGDGFVGLGTDNPSTRLHVAGDVTVTGDILLSGADCAEQFDVAGPDVPEPGTVVVIDEELRLQESQTAYDTRVAGVVSGAGNLRHALVLDSRTSRQGRIPVAMIGKVFCKVDAQYSPIGTGDLLTSSPTPGHAMKASDPGSAFGSIIGKALKPLGVGTGLIPILVALQ